MESALNTQVLQLIGKLSVLLMMMAGLAGCSAGDSSTSSVTTSGSAALQGPMVLVNNTGNKTLTSVAVRGDSGNAVVGTIDAAEFENVALGDMQVSDGEWVFVNLAAVNKVAMIDPLTAATPVHEGNVAAGTRPVHMYRDKNDGEVIWIMNDGDTTVGPTHGDDLVNCASQGGGSVTVIHNSHLGPGGQLPTVLGTTCLLADGHKVAAFSSGAGVPKRVFVSSEDAGEIAVLDDDETSVATYRKMIARIDLCNPLKEANPAACNDESATPLTTPLTPNSSAAR